MASDEIVVGVDFASDGVRIAGMRMTSIAPSVVAVGMVRWPTGAWVDGQPARETVVREALREAFADAKLPSDRVVVGIAGDGIHRTITLPTMTDAELAEQIRWESDQHVPAEVSDYRLEYRVVSRDPSVGQMQVALSGCRRDRLEAHVRIVREAELRPREALLEYEALRRVAVASGVVRDDVETAIAIVRASRDGAAVAVLVGEDIRLAATVEGTGPDAIAGEVRRRLDFFTATEDRPVANVFVAGPEATRVRSSLTKTEGAGDVRAWASGRLRSECDPTRLPPFVTAVGLALPGADTLTVGAPPPSTGVWSRIRGWFS